MPTLSAFYGIVVTMYTEINTNHHLPHIHAKYAEDEIAVALDGTVLEQFNFVKVELARSA